MADDVKALDLTKKTDPEIQWDRVMDRYFPTGADARIPVLYSPQVHREMSTLEHHELAHRAHVARRLRQGLLALLTGAASHD